MEQQRILIVEDEKIIALDLERRLERNGFKVVGTTGMASEAIELAGSEMPDLVLMDIYLADETDHSGRGIEAAQEIRRRYAIPVVFLTAYADDDTIQRAKIAEPVGYILKPFKEKDLISTIDIGIYKSRMDRELLRQERLFSAILRSAGDAIIATDSEDRIQFMNPTAETLTGWKSADATGKPLDEVFTLVAEGSEQPVSLDRTRESEDHGAVAFDSVYLKNRYGARIHIEGTVALIRDSRLTPEGQTIAFRDVTDLKRLNETVTYQASHDALTGVMNREGFATRLETIAKEAEKRNRAHSFLFIDIDQFKVINDVCGHVAGDELLRQVVRGIEDLMDTEYVLGRLGGDQFGLVILDTSIEHGQQLARLMVAHLHRKFVWQHNSYNVSVSIGTAPVSRGNSTVADILAAGDDACSLAKEFGGNAVRSYETSDFVFLRRRGEMQWIARLTDALDENRFLLYHQGIEKLTDPSDKKFEILLRLRNPDGSLTEPNEFIAAAERYKLMPSIDKWVIGAACRYIREAIRREIDVPMICVNLSGASLAETTLQDYFLFMLDEHEITGSRFCLEITETNAIQNFARATAFMSRLKEEGTAFALDDFGNGFSSFAYLKRLPVDYLKIDGSFVKGIDSDPIDRAMVESVNTIGQTMGMKTIAEYVHNDRVRKVLTEMGVDYGQGYAISKPVPLPGLDDLRAEA
jgi:diguanylate cyclase (GGDEF)-like protein/PAS domain S-box-containing protein